MKQVKKVRKIFLPLIISIWVFACGNIKNTDVDTLSKVYVNLLVVEQMYSTVPDSIDIKKEEVFQKYGIMQEEFKEELENIKGDIELWDEFFNLSHSYLDSLKARGEIN